MPKTLAEKSTFGAPLEWLSGFHGFLLVDKPEGISSQDVITRLQRILIERSGGKVRKRDLPKMGHGGTLDPFATGLLVLAVGDGTKLARYLLDSEKTYTAEVRFGERTASGDRTNEVIERSSARPESRETMEQAAREFLDSPYLQIPPMYSAKKVDGKRLYEMAREGTEIERKAVECRVLEFSLGKETSAEAAPALPEFASIRVRVSSGTYVRTLAEDWAGKFGSLAHLASLRRFASGPFSVEAALTLDRFAESTDWSKTSAFTPFDECLRGKFPSVSIGDEEARAILEGRKDVIGGIAPRLPTTAARVALHDSYGLRAVFFRIGSTWDFERVFPLANRT